MKPVTNSSMITSYIRYICLLPVTILLTVILENYILFPYYTPLMQGRATVPILGMENQGIERSGSVSVRYQFKFMH